MMKLHLTLKSISIPMKIFESFCIENGFAKYFVTFPSLFEYFVLHIMIIS